MALPLTEKLASLLVDETFRSRCVLLTQDIAETMLDNGQPGNVSDEVWAKRVAFCRDLLNSRINLRQILQSLLMEESVRNLVAAAADGGGVSAWRQAVGDTALRTALASRLVRYAGLRA